jgi:hypothetical protein
MFITEPLAPGTVKSHDGKATPPPVAYSEKILCPVEEL